MNGIDLAERLAEMQREYADRHRPMRSIQHYRERHARRHPEHDYDGEQHLWQYQTKQMAVRTAMALSSYGHFATK